MKKEETSVKINRIPRKNILQRKEKYGRKNGKLPPAAPDVVAMLRANKGEVAISYMHKAQRITYYKCTDHQLRLPPATRAPAASHSATLPQDGTHYLGPKRLHHGRRCPLSPAWAARWFLHVGSNDNTLVAKTRTIPATSPP